MYRPRQLRPRGFTVLELLVVIGVIVILAGLLYVGFGRIGSAGQTNQTKVVLSNLHGMWTELEVRSRLDTTATVLYGATNALAAPGVVADEAGSQRHGPAVLKTQRVLSRLMAVPENRSMLQKLPPERLMNVLWQPTTAYIAGDHVSAPNGVHMVCKQAHTSGSEPPAVPDANWDPDTNPVPVVLDAWGNPILFVPAGGMTDVGLDGQRQEKNLVKHRVTSRGVVQEAAAAPAGSRPFWASAGPDGAFSYRVDTKGDADPANDEWIAGGDDNVYSFEE